MRNCECAIVIAGSFTKVSRPIASVETAAKTISTSAKRSPAKFSHVLSARFSKSVPIAKFQAAVFLAAARDVASAHRFHDEPGGVVAVVPDVVAAAHRLAVGCVAAVDGFDADERVVVCPPVAGGARFAAADCWQVGSCPGVPVDCRRDGSGACRDVRAGCDRGDQVDRHPAAQAGHCQDVRAGRPAGQVGRCRAGQAFRYLAGQVARRPEVARLVVAAGASLAVADARRADGPRPDSNGGCSSPTGRSRLTQQARPCRISKHRSGRWKKQP
jgi:hypothetical protein